MSLADHTVTVRTVRFSPELFVAALGEVFGAPEPDGTGEPISAQARIEAELVQNPNFAVHDIGIVLDHIDDRVFVHVLHHPASGFSGQVAVRVNLTERCAVSRLVSIDALLEEAAKLAEPSRLTAVAAAMVDAMDAMLADAAADLGFDLVDSDEAGE